MNASELSKEGIEVWAPLAVFGLRVSNLGNCFDVYRNRLLPQSLDRGYPKISFSRNGKVITKRVSGLVMLAFCGPKPDKCGVLHTDDNKANSALHNLSYGTQKQNWADMRRNGIERYSPKGADNHLAKLTEQDVTAIRKRFDGNEAAASIADDYGITPSNVWRIGKRLSWKHI